MARIAPLAVTFALVAIAAGVAAGGYYAVGLEPWTAFAIGIGVLFVAFVAYTNLQRAGEQRQFQQRLEGLAQLEDMLARTLQTLPARVSMLEERLAHRLDGETGAALQETERLGAIVKQLGQTVEALERRLERSRPVAVETPATERARPAAAETAGTEPSKPAAVVQALPLQAADVRKPPEPDPGNRIRRAIDAERIEIFLQPIITLPQRRPRYYDASVQLRDDTGQPMLAADFLPRAERAGLAAKLDNLILFRAIQVLRRLAVRQRETALFCGISGRTLSDAAAFAEFAGFVEANRPVAESLVFTLSQRVVRGFGETEPEHLATLRRLGCRFCLGDVTDLKLEPQKLAELGFRFVKVAALVMLDRNVASRSGVIAAEISDQLARAGVDLICDRISAEAMVVDLLDCDVRLGQGDLFARPRPVRQDIMSAVGAA